MKLNIIITILILTSTAVLAQTLCTPASYNVGYPDPSGDYNNTAGPAGDIISVNYSTQGCVMMVVDAAPSGGNASVSNLVWDIIYDNGTGGTSISTYVPTNLNNTACFFDIIIDEHYTGGFPVYHYHTSNLTNPPTYFNAIPIANISSANCGSDYCIEWQPLNLPASSTPFVAATFNLGTPSFDTLENNLGCLGGAAPVPEFGNIALAIALLGGLTGVFLLRELR